MTPPRSPPRRLLWDQDIPNLFNLLFNDTTGPVRGADMGPHGFELFQVRSGRRRCRRCRCAHLFLGLVPHSRTRCSCGTQVHRARAHAFGIHRCCRLRYLLSLSAVVAVCCCCFCKRLGPQRGLLPLP
jgi:hypothetical protein